MRNLQRMKRRTAGKSREHRCRIDLSLPKKIDPPDTECMRLLRGLVGILLLRRLYTVSAPRRAGGSLRIVKGPLLGSRNT